MSDPIITPVNQPSPELSIDGIYRYINQNGITRLRELLSNLPEHFNKNFVFVEETGGVGRSSLEYPRIVQFGADARLLINVSSDPADPTYNLLDMAHMNSASGEWEFAQLNFNTNPVSLRRNPTSCQECHGVPARPLWGSYLDWPGVIGDNPLPGPQAESLTVAEANRLNALKAGLGNQDRFHGLIFPRSDFRPGRPQTLQGHAYNIALTVSNQTIGLASAESIYIRLKKSPYYTLLREELLLLGQYGGRDLSNEEKQRIANLIASLGGNGNNIQALFKVLGLDFNHEMSLSTLPGEQPNLRWNAGSGSLDGMVYFLILEELARNDFAVESILRSTPKGSSIYGIFSCPDLGSTVSDLVTFRMLHGYRFKGINQQRLHEIFYPQDIITRTHGIFDLPKTRLVEYLRRGISRVEDLDSVRERL
ncbi:MAG: hypothetical protein K0U59_05515 [Gammaproteobacteria bacterium]|nr:hypothetical protein [Gammaproteobacteria bacterium]